jgi:hypothetical protein
MATLNGRLFTNDIISSFRVLKLEPNNVEAQLRYAWLKLHRGLNHDNDLAVATSLLEGLEQDNKKTRNSIFSAEHERIFLDLRCELLSRTSTTSTVSSMKLQSIIQNYPRHIGLHLLLLDTFKISGDYAKYVYFVPFLAAHTFSSSFLQCFGSY